MTQVEKKKCIRYTVGPMAGVVVRRPVSECKSLVDGKAAVYVSKGTMKSFLNQYRKSIVAMNIAKKHGVTDWNDLPDNLALADYGNGVTSLYVTKKGVNALDALKTGCDQGQDLLDKIKIAKEELDKAAPGKDREAALLEYKIILSQRTNTGTHYFLEKLKRQKNVKAKKYNASTADAITDNTSASSVEIGESDSDNSKT